MTDADDRQILIGGPYDGQEFRLPLEGDLKGDETTLTMPVGRDGDLVQYRSNGDRDEQGRLIFRLVPRLA